MPALHKSAEPNSLAVRIGVDQRAGLIAAEPSVYYVTDHYVNYPTVLVRLSGIHPDALRDLLGMAWSFVTKKNAGAAEDACHETHARKAHPAMEAIRP
jgi:hypothetical protein